nr:hypothetical protein Iba_chr15aCG11150 [Ipomoea batatas]
MEVLCGLLMEFCRCRVGEDRVRGGYYIPSVLFTGLALGTGCRRASLVHSGTSCFANQCRVTAWHGRRALSSYRQFRGTSCFANQCRVTAWHGQRALSSYRQFRGTIGL